MSGRMTLAAWIAARRPPVPGRFARWMEPEDATRTVDASAAPGALAEEGVRSLARALSPDGRPRAGAFDLLAADGFLSWAAEAALETDDPDAVLAALTQRVTG